jgi:hypothetical protein
MSSRDTLRVFLCHSAGDKLVARQLYTRLKADGFDPWLDEENLVAGQNWQHEIAVAVRTCDKVLVCLSKTSITKEGYIQKEVREVLDVQKEKLEDKIFIIPVRIEEVTVPDRLRQWQWVNLFHEGGVFKEDDYQKVVRALTYQGGPTWSGIRLDSAELQRGESRNPS